MSLANNRLQSALICLFSNMRAHLKGLGFSVTNWSYSSCELISANLSLTYSLDRPDRISSLLGLVLGLVYKKKNAVATVPGYFGISINRIAAMPWLYPSCRAFYHVLSQNIFPEFSGCSVLHCRHLTPEV